MNQRLEPQRVEDCLIKGKEPKKYMPRTCRRLAGLTQIAGYALHTLHHARRTHELVQCVLRIRVAETDRLFNRVEDSIHLHTTHRRTLYNDGRTAVALRTAFNKGAHHRHAIAHAI